jgi:hypothetical protein
VHKEIGPEGKTVNAEFYKAVIDCPLECIQRVRPAAFCSARPQNCTFCEFLTPNKCYNPLSPLPPYFPDLSPPSYFPFPNLKMKLKGFLIADVGEIQEAVTDELKKVQKEEFSAVFRKCTTAQKSIYMPIELIWNEELRVFVTRLRFLRNNS